MQMDRFDLSYPMMLELHKSDFTLIIGLEGKLRNCFILAMNYRTDILAYVENVHVMA